ncbi:hypothetical protein [Sphingomonas sanguinis]|jgi:hypothetical protein|uniref:DUF2530 domain-containing protein n=1 Tax=Sphingomonas sanguinis TaxID=33051 RepID=A0A7Y7UQS7_9SPHN|nr:hypothetical protein [Sphingomonas sanguinis]MBZ6380609.1 hypothetical protein [Sphingomonas sanguinis]NNG49580.1 hypothetical protein [Sphingomonas sanguinis]NNG53242.1 hypothetical protein [Sphingomonas sanguinis]NVP29911.1 hypothetical protein [Sphingomonas sanguinis]
MRVRTELFYIGLGLMAALVMTWAAAWAYPLARTEIWWCGAAAAVATVAMGVGPLHRARIADRMARRHSEQ